MAEELNSETFNDVISSGVVLVDFYATWCGPCKTLAPVMEELVTDFEGKVKIYKVNADENPEILQKFNIRGMPTVLIFKNGEVVETMVGANTKSAYTVKLEMNL